MAIIDKIQLSGTVYTIGNETTTAVTSASTDNEIPTAKAVYDAIPQGGGGKAIEAGRGISIATGETADTVSFNLPISAGTGTNALIYNSTTNVASGIHSNAEGEYTTASGNYSFAGGTSFSEANGEASFAFGYSVVANKNYSAAFGIYTTTKNLYEFGCGILNKSVKGIIGSKDSGSTLFSVGNGKNDTKHNAFEIRQNGDIYIADTNDTSTTNYYEKPMIKLQDALGGGGSITVDPSLDSGSTNPVANSAITNAINDRQLKREYVGSEKVFSSFSTVNRREICYPVFRCYSNNSTNTELVLNNKDLGLYFPTVNGKYIFSTNKNETNWLGDVIEASAITTSVTSSSTDAQVPSAKAVNDKLGGLSLVKLTQSEYDALATKDSNTLYVIVN